MKNFVVAALLTCFTAAPAVAAGNNVGINFSVDSVFGIHGEWDISSMPMIKNEPVSFQAFIKNYSQNISPGNSWATTGYGAVGIYDLTSIAKLDIKTIHPYVGIGLMYVHATWSGFKPAPYTGITSGIYVTGGARYFLTPTLAADFNYNNFGSLTAGLNFVF